MDTSSYQVEVIVRARLPRAASSPEDLALADPTLPGAFPDFAAWLASAKVSPFFAQLYDLKVAQIRREVDKMDAILSRHNFYDCQTILEFAAPSTGRRALLALADMDVNVDGSDGDRNVEVDGSSQFFLPQTSYRWEKLTGRPNPFLRIEEKRLAGLRSELSSGGLSAVRADTVRDGIELARRRIFDLKKWSFLVSEADPFIVLPGFLMRDKANPFSPGIGDFALVLFQGKAYPAIVGDAGPSLKMGEASLRICRELNARSSAMARPVSDLKVAYLVFPGTADATASQPNLANWHARCLELAGEIGGLAAEIHNWPDIVKPWPTPTPEPSPSASPAPSGSPAPAATATPADKPAAADPPINPPFVNE